MLACSKNVASGPPGEGGAPGAGSGPERLAVVTDRFDIARSASTLRETVLTTRNVAPGGFGLLFSRAITGDAYAQPLYVAGVDFGGASSTTSSTSSPATTGSMRSTLTVRPTTRPPPIRSGRACSARRCCSAPVADYDPGCTDMRNEVGITSTPVISLADNKIFVVAKVPGDQHLHALDLATGADADGSPISVGNIAMTAFDPMIHLNRAPLLLLGGVVYVAYGSHCDRGAYHGWLFGYDAKTTAARPHLQHARRPAPGARLAVGRGPVQRRHRHLRDCRQRHLAPVAADGVNMGNNVVR